MVRWDLCRGRVVLGCSVCDVLRVGKLMHGTDRVRKVQIGLG